jgi:hypothetical protein
MIRIDYVQRAFRVCTYASQSRRRLANSNESFTLSDGSLDRAQCKFRHVYITYVSRHLQSMKRASHSISFAIVLHYMQHTQRHTYIWKFSALHLSGSIVLLQFVKCMPLPVYIGHDYFLKLLPMIRLTAPKASLSAFKFAIISGSIQGHISVTGWHKHPLDMGGISVLLLT